jgi:HK97 gp10 family phage protein
MANTTQTAISVHGVDEVRNALKDVRRSVSARILKSAMAYSIRPLVAATQAAAPSQFGTLKRSIISKVKKYTRGDLDGAVVVGLVGPRSDYRQTVSKPNIFSFKNNDVVSRPSTYAHLVEYGTKAHNIPFPGFGRKAKKSRATLNTGKHTFRHPGTKAQPFIHPTAKANASMTIARFSEQVHTRVKIEWAKAVSGGKKFWASDT